MTTVYAIWEGKYEDAYPVLFATRALAVEYEEPGIRERFQKLGDPAFWRKPRNAYMRTCPKDWADSRAAFWRAMDEATYVAEQLDRTIIEMEVCEEVPVPA